LIARLKIPSEISGPIVTRDQQGETGIFADRNDAFNVWVYPGPRVPLGGPPSVTVYYKGYVFQQINAATLSKRGRGKRRIAAIARNAMAEEAALA